MSRNNFYVSTSANSPEFVNLGLAALRDAARALRSPRALMVCALKSNLYGLIHEAMGDGAVKELANGRELPLSPGCRLSFHHSRTLPFSASGAPVLLCFPDERLIQQVDEMRDVPALIVLPWVPKHLQLWLFAYGANDLLNRVDAKPVSIADPLVVRGLEVLRKLINMSTGVGHPSDKEAVVAMFRALRAHQQDYDPIEVGAWFVQRGMRIRDAIKVMEIAAAPSRFRGSASKNRQAEAEVLRWKTVH